MASAACNECQYFDDHHANGQKPQKNEGLCRFNPPVTQPEASSHGLWPIVASKDWCGHFQPDHMGR
jgi:hypothetical protein